MKQFVFDNWKEILEIFLTICCLIICLIKRKKVDPTLSGICCQLPELVDLAEKKFGSGNGLEKKKFVLDSACKLYEKSTGVRVTRNSGIYCIFENDIETILSTPQKKGVK